MPTKAELLEGRAGWYKHLSSDDPARAQQARAQVNAYDKEIQNLSPDTPGEGLLDDLRNADTALGNAVGMYGMDELTSGLGAAVDSVFGDQTYGEAYNQRMSDFASRTAEFRKDVPASMPAEMAAGVLGLGKLGSVLGGAGGVMKSILGATAAGGAGGALAADPGSRTEGGFYGALFGGGLAGAGQAGGWAAKLPFWADVGRVFNRSTGDLGKQTAKAASVALEGAEADPNKLREAALAAQAAGKSVEPMAVGNPALADTAAAAAAQGGAKTTQAAGILRSYALNARERVLGLVKKYGKDVPPAELRKSLLTSRKETANRAYTAALDTPAPTSAVLKSEWKWLRGSDSAKSINLKAVVKEAKAVYRKENGKDLPMGSVMDIHNNPSMRGWDAIVKQLDVAAHNLKLSPDARGVHAASRTRIIEELYKGNDAYKQARQLYRGDSEALELVDLGHTLITKPKPSDVRAVVDDINKRHVGGFQPQTSKLDQELIVSGIVEALDDKLSTMAGSGTGRTVDASRAFNTSATREVLNEVLGEEIGDDIYKMVEREMRTRAASNTIDTAAASGRSARARQPVTGDVAASQPAWAARTQRTMVTNALTNLQRYGDDVADELGQVLITADPARQVRLLDAVIKRRADNPRIMRAVRNLIQQKVILPPSTPLSVGAPAATGSAYMTR